MLQASTIMTYPVITFSPETTVADAAALLAKHGISAVPVCGADGTLLGMISEGDLLRPFTTSNRLRRDWWLEMLAEGNDLAPEFVAYIRSDRHRVKDLMSVPVITAPPDADLADLLNKNGIKRVPVVRDGALLGIVTRADLVRAIARAPALADSAD